MALPYYTHASGLPANQTRALAAQVRDELDQIAASFNLLPIPSAIIGGISNYAVDTGAANAYVISVSPSTLVAYADGLTLRFKAANANTGAATINVNGLGLRSIVRPDGTSLTADDIYAGQICQISYNNTTGNFQLSITPLAAVYQALAYANAAAASASAAAGSASAASSSASAASSSASLASQWATSLSLVDGVYYGSRYYSIEAFNSATAAGISEANAALSEAAAAASAALAAQTFNGTSTTSLTVGAGSKSLTTQTGKAWVVGQYISVARTSDPVATVMRGQVTGYTSGTGALTFNCDDITGSGTFTDWTIGLSGPRGASGSRPLVHVLTTSVNCVAGYDYSLENVAATTATLPASFADGDVVGILPTNQRADNVVARNGNLLIGLAEDMTLDNAYAPWYLRALTGYGWRFA